MSMKFFAVTALFLTIFGAAAQNKEKVINGVDVFLEKYTGLVAGKRVGLVTNPSGVDSSGRQTVDILRKDQRINLTLLMAPEHGIRGDVEAGKNFTNQKDARTGLPVHSLYGGKDHRPTPEALKQIDVLIYNLQDNGCRTYTYIWHLAECMSACAEAGIPVIVLDVPNPLGAVTADGPIREEKFKSFIGLYPVPLTYGLTVGELARYLNTEEKINCKLTVVPMRNYRRGMGWNDTGLKWIQTSPNVPTATAANGYTVTGIIGVLGMVNIGLKFLPFEIIAAPWIDADHFANYLNEQKIPGISFKPYHGKPAVGFMANKDIHGVKIAISNHAACRPVMASIAILCYLQKYGKNEFKWSPEKYKDFDKAVGNSRVRNRIMAGDSFRSIVAEWDKPLQQFQQRAAPYKIYRQ